MRAELVLMGRRVDMALRSRRRGLVVAIYAVMATMLAGFWFLDHWRSTATILYWIMLLMCRLFLGGYYRGGLVKPFSNKPPRERMEPHPFLALGLRVYYPGPGEDERTFRNDERELQQRDHAHYQAYQVVGSRFWFRGFWFIRGC